MGKIRKMIEGLRDSIAGTENLKKKEKNLKQEIQNCRDENERRTLMRKYRSVRNTRKRKEQRAGWIMAGSVALVIACGAGGALSVHAVSVKRQKAAEEKAAQEAAELQAQKEVEEAARIAKENEPVEIVLTLTGDCTLGTDEYFDQDTSLNAYYESYGPEYFLKNVKSIFEADDITIVNMEGTLTDSTDRADKEYAFKAPKEFSSILTSSSVEAANLANNHSHDYGDQSYTDTITELESKGIKTFGYDEVAVIEAKGIKVGMFGIYELYDHLERKDQIRSCIQKLKDQDVNMIVAVFHWSNELVEYPDENQLELGAFAVDEGADLVVGHHPHIVQGVGEYKGKTIAYSLGNFCFGGNSSPSDMDTMILQMKYTFVGGEMVDSERTIIPCSISSESYYNNYQPTVLTGDEAERVLEKIRGRIQ